MPGRLKEALVKGEFTRLSRVPPVADFCLLFTFNLHVCIYFLFKFNFFSNLYTQFGAQIQKLKVKYHMLFRLCQPGAFMCLNKGK